MTSERFSELLLTKQYDYAAIVVRNIPHFSTREIGEFNCERGKWLFHSYPGYPLDVDELQQLIDLHRTLPEYE